MSVVGGSKGAWANAFYGIAGSNRVFRPLLLTKWDQIAIYYQLSSLGDGVFWPHDDGMTLAPYFAAEMSVFARCNVSLR